MSGQFINSEQQELNTPVCSPETLQENVRCSSPDLELNLFLSSSPPSPVNYPKNQISPLPKTPSPYPTSSSSTSRSPSPISRSPSPASPISPNIRPRSISQSSTSSSSSSSSSASTIKSSVSSVFSSRLASPTHTPPPISPPPTPKRSMPPLSPTPGPSKRQFSFPPSPSEPMLTSPVKEKKFKPDLRNIHESLSSISEDEEEDMFNDQAVETHDNDMDDTVNELTTKREKIIEQFLKDIFDSLPTDPSASASELARLWKEEARKRISKRSVTLFHKLQPLVEIMLDQKMSTKMKTSFAEIDVLPMTTKDMALCYRRCFDTWVDAHDCVSFEAINTRLLGNIEIKDMFILTFFIFCTCRRVKNDNLLQLGVVGCSTSGKSTIFESCLMEGSHVTTSEQGVGRFRVDNKPILMFHDVHIRMLAASKDTEKIKTIARTEPTVTKIHSTVYTLQPTFLFYSSNERLLHHIMSPPATHDARIKTLAYPNQVNQLGKTRIPNEHLIALQNRFIEVFVRSPPPLPLEDLPHSGGFERMHGILGIYKRVLGIMVKYKATDFFSPVVRQYILHGLIANHKEYQRVFHVDHSLTLDALVRHHIPKPLQSNLLQMLK